VGVTEQPLAVVESAFIRWRIGRYADMKIMPAACLEFAQL